jgi:Ca2+-binding RTX toxin-like protein
LSIRLLLPSARCPESDGQDAPAARATRNSTARAAFDAADITLSRSGAHAVVMMNANGAVITLDETFYSATLNYGFDRIEFAAGLAWDRTQIRANAWYRGTGGNDTINASNDADTIDGLGGNDTINANGGADTLIGGTGNDTLTGGTGNDVFVFGAGFGQDTITDFAAGPGVGDVIRFVERMGRPARPPDDSGTHGPLCDDPAVRRPVFAP